MRSSEWDFESLMGCCVISTILCIVALIVGVNVACACGGLNIPYSEGSRSGTVYKFSQKGLIWKTHEGELALGFSRNTGGENSIVVPEIFYFSASDSEAIRNLSSAAEEGRRVTVKYRQYLLRGFDKGKTSYDVYAVIPAMPSGK